MRCTYCGTGLIVGRYKRQTSFLPGAHGCRPTFRPRKPTRTTFERLLAGVRLHYPEALLASCAGLIAWHFYLTYHPPAGHRTEPGTRSAAPPSDAPRIPTIVKLGHRLPGSDVAAVSAPPPEREPRSGSLKPRPRGSAQDLFVDADPLDGSSYARFAPAVQPVPDEVPREVKPGPDQAPVVVAGLWGPTADACSASEDRRRGLLPVVINDRGARAGSVSCSFKDKTATGVNSWSVVAQCRNGQERWTSTVRLALSGSRLTWTSARGSQAYVRCDRTLLASR